MHWNLLGDRFKLPFHSLQNGGLSSKILLKTIILQYFKPTEMGREPCPLDLRDLTCSYFDIISSDAF